MRIGHVRERHAPTGTPWRLAAALDPADAPGRWLDLEIARRRLVRLDERLAHNDPLFRQPVSTLDAHLGTTGGEQRGRVAALAAIIDPFIDGAVPLAADDDAVLVGADLAFGPPILRPPCLRDFYAFEGHVADHVEASRPTGSGGVVPPADLLLLKHLGAARPGEPVRAPTGSVELDYELEVGALVDTPRGPRPPSRRGRDRRLHDPQRLVGPGPPARRDGRPARAGEGQGLRHDDRPVARDPR